MHRLLFSGALALSALVLGASGFATPANAAFYGASFSSPTGNVTFLNVADLNGLYGMPTAQGNSLDFNPSTFEVACDSVTCPPTADSISDTLTFRIDAGAGFVIEDIVLSESGDTTLNDFSIPGGFAATTVVADVFVDILELDGVGVSGINANSAMVFTGGGVFETTDEGNGSHIWSGLLNLDIDAVIAGAGESGKATLVEISLSNTLTAYDENGAVAFIEKKDIDGLAITVIPEPSTALLMMLGLSGLSLAARRMRA